MDENKIFILTDHRKSGTSLLHRLLDGHPYLNVYPVDLSVLYAYFSCYTNNQGLSTSFLKKKIKISIRKKFNESF